jgi:hypothetical protein
MSNTIVVQYRTTPEAADENERLVRDVYRELAAEGPSGFHYMTIRLDDGVSFVHVAVLDEGAENPLPTTPAFDRFQSDLASRVATGPTPAAGTAIGTYGLLGRPA